MSPILSRGKRAQKLNPDGTKGDEVVDPDKTLSEPGQKADQEKELGDNDALFEPLQRSGDIFFDTTLSFLATNEIMKVLGNFSKVMERYHEQPKISPADYAQKAREIFGALPKAGTTGKTEGVSFYDKIIALVQSKYPGLASCCIVAYIGIASTALTLILGLLACCCVLCCEKQSCRSCCRARPRGDLCEEDGCGCCGETEASPLRRDEYRLVPRAEHARQAQPDPETSRQRDTTASRAAAAPEPHPVVQWGTMRAGEHPGPSAPSKV